MNLRRDHRVTSLEDVGDVIATFALNDFSTDSVPHQGDAKECNQNAVERSLRQPEHRPNLAIELPQLEPVDGTADHLKNDPDDQRRPNEKN